MASFTDQTGHVTELPHQPRRIISLVPSQSELLWHYGLRDELVGITKFCIHPDEMFRSKTRVGGTKKLNIEKIRALKPDLIIGNKEENEKEQIELLQREFPVWMSDIYDFDDAFEMMGALGTLTEKKAEAEKLIATLQNGLPALRDLLSGSVAYLIWYKPYMLAAHNTFIDHVLNHLGLKNVAAELQRYPEVDADELKRLNPQYVFLSSEPFPFDQKHVEEIQKILPSSKVILADGEIFSWYGSRLLHLPEYVLTLKQTLL